MAGSKTTHTGRFLAWPRGAAGAFGSCARRFFNHLTSYETSIIMLIYEQVQYYDVQIHKFSSSCPPWALPREEIPIHVRISKDVTPLLKSAKVDLPGCLELVDTINLVDHRITGKRLIVNEIGKTKKSDFDYFGIVIATREPFDELKKEIPVNIEFEYNDGKKEDLVQNVRVFPTASGI